MTFGKFQDELKALLQAHSLPHQGAKVSAEMQAGARYSAAMARVSEAFGELSKAWEIDPMGERYREAETKLSDAIAALAEVTG